MLYLSLDTTNSHRRRFCVTTYHLVFDGGVGLAISCRVAENIILIVELANVRGEKRLFLLLTLLFTYY